MGIIINKRRVEKPRLFLIECGSPQDVMAGRLESPTLEAFAKLAGYEVLVHHVNSRRSLRDHCKYLASMDRAPDPRSGAPICIHIAAHGNDDGLLCGTDLDFTWSDLFDVVKPILTTEYPGPHVISISACDADQQKLTDQISGAFKSISDLRPPRYVFCTEDQPSCRDAVLAWEHLYRRMDSELLDDKTRVQGVLDSIRGMELPCIVYWRWDRVEKRYMRYAGPQALAARRV
jgi:hypothetical protein